MATIAPWEMRSQCLEDGGGQAIASSSTYIRRDKLGADHPSVAETHRELVDLDRPALNLALPTVAVFLGGVLLCVVFFLWTNKPWRLMVLGMRLDYPAVQKNVSVGFSLRFFVFSNMVASWSRLSP